MKIPQLLLMSMLSIAGCGFAADITIDLDKPDQLVADGKTISFTGEIVNNDPAIVDLNSIEVDLNGIVFTLNESAFFSGPPTVGATNGTPKTHTVDFEMFQVTADVNAPLGVQTGTVTILGGEEGAGGYNSSTQNVLGTASFQVTVVPESSTLTMTVLAAVALCFLRRFNIRSCRFNSRISRVKA